jgi:hypothetical protein
MKKKNLKSLKLNKNYISGLSDSIQGGRDPRYITDAIMCGGTDTCNTNCAQQTCNDCSNNCGTFDGCPSVPAAISCQIC